MKLCAFTNMQNDVRINLWKDLYSTGCIFQLHGVKLCAFAHYRGCNCAYSPSTQNWKNSYFTLSWQKIILCILRICRMSFKFKHFSKTDLIFETNLGYESRDSFDKKKPEVKKVMQVYLWENNIPNDVRINLWID